MSYLDIPHIHFGGLFWAAPSTINNITTNYDPSVRLENQSGQYNENVVLWNALGVAQFYLQNCSVLGGVDSSGKFIDSGSDPLIGAPIITPAPLTPMSDGASGIYDIPKMVDLDPDQQGRTELYGMRFQITLPAGGTFGGPMSIPQLRELGPRVTLTKVGGSFSAVGQFMGSIVQPEWPAGDSGSELVRQLKAACTNGVAVSLTVDLHWNFPQISQNGLMFCYGRVHGTMGPLRPGETGQTLYGRRMFAPSSAAPPPAPVLSKAPPAPAVAAPPWNAGYAAMSPVNLPSVISVDLGLAIPLAVQKDAMPPGVNGTPQFEMGITIGSTDSSGEFTPLANGAVAFGDYVQISAMEKNCYCWRNSGVFTVLLAAGEAQRLQSQPLAVQVNNTMVLQEIPSGVWVQFSQLSTRMPLPGASASIPMLVTQYGAPYPNYAPAAFSIQVSEWVQQGGQWTNQVVPSTDLKIVAYQPAQTDDAGAIAMNLATQVSQMDLSALRADLESRVYFVTPPTDPSIDIADDGLPVSMLVWQPFTAPANPSWVDDIQPVMGAYARLYPGMKEKVDIGDRTAAQSNAGAIAARMSLPVAHPAYMPVTRDMTPAKVQMIADFMQRWAEAAQRTT
uniref:Uncharacterized protein n=1 Tax=uncultured Acidobacteriota bacterium TaxID=171953 RepID=F2YWV3_9BACT|nr:hypothetical protein Lip018_ORF002 [uncultured Acidobacteriota bacterium]